MARRLGPGTNRVHVAAHTVQIDDGLPNPGRRVDDDGVPVPRDAKADFSTRDDPLG